MKNNVKTKYVELTGKYGSGKTVKIMVPSAAEPPFLLSQAQNQRLRKKAGLILGDYFADVQVY